MLQRRVYWSVQHATKVAGIRLNASWQSRAARKEHALSTCDGFVFNSNMRQLRELQRALCN